MSKGLLVMDTKSIKELGILHEVSTSEHVSQRYLSKKLGMTSGLVNLYIKRLARKGYIKITGMNRRRLKYFLTPAGIKQKTRLTYEFAMISYKYLRTATGDITEKLAEMEKAEGKNVVILGTGELADLCLLLMKEFDINVVAVVDDRAKSKRFFGYPVVPADVLKNLEFDRIVVTTVDEPEKVDALIQDIGIEKDKVCWLLEVPPK